MGRVRQIAKRAAFELLGSAPRLNNRLKALAGGRATTILNLHRVGPDDGSDYRPLDPRLFNDLLIFVSENFALRTFADMAEPSTKPKLILSFDDGYKDFVTCAAPLLAKHGIRVNQNVIPASIETGRPPLNVVAQDFVGKAPAELVRKLDIPGFAAPAGAGFGMRLSAFLKNRSQQSQNEYAECLLPQFEAWQEFRHTPMMSAEDVRQVAADHEIGAHSYAHSSMEHETHDFLTADLSNCRDYFRDILGLDMRIYAFPNGSCGLGHVEVARSAGVEHVLLVGEAFATQPHVHTRFTFDAASPSEMRFKALGGLASVPA